MESRVKVQEWLRSQWLESESNFIISPEFTVRSLSQILLWLWKQGWVGVSFFVDSRSLKRFFDERINIEIMIRLSFLPNHLWIIRERLDWIFERLFWKYQRFTWKWLIGKYLLQTIQNYEVRERFQWFILKMFTRVHQPIFFKWPDQFIYEGIISKRRRMYEEIQ